MKKYKAVMTPGILGSDRERVWRVKLKKATTVALSILASVSLFIVIVFTCLEAVAFDESRYRQMYLQYGIEADSGMSADDLARVTHELLLYCRGDRDNLDMQAVIGGEAREVFSDREKAHMVDVQNLFIRGMKVRTVLVISLFFLLLLLLYVARKRTIYELARGWVFTASAMGAALVLIGVAFAVDFEGAWTEFHHIFFTNDLWLLSYDDMLIRMFIKLFDGIVRAVIVTSAVSLAAVTAAAALVLRLEKIRNGRGKAKPEEPAQQK